MDDPCAIVVEGLSKRYVLGRREGLRRTLAETLSGGGAAPGGQELWALRDVSFEVPRGQVLGLLGRNGAGKSTILKILSRITRPTSGRARVRGRVASLLEVGTGFHPELSGRDNIFLNGSILGMKHEEIQRKFDEIVAFSGISRFLDTPVKRYSSGMYVRLAFAVAAHVEPDILLVDEVLAVGDVEFQKKCLGKMRDVTAGGGRTVIFVSHHLNSLVALCSSGLVLEAGQVSFQGDIQAATTEYLGGIARNALAGRAGGIVQRVEFVTSPGAPAAHFHLREALRLRCTLAPVDLSTRYVVVTVRSPLDEPILAASTEEAGLAGIAGEFDLTLENHLAPGDYGISIAIHDRGSRQVLAEAERAAEFTVLGYTPDRAEVSTARDRVLLHARATWTAGPAA